MHEDAAMPSEQETRIKELEELLDYSVRSAAYLDDEIEKAKAEARMKEIEEQIEKVKAE